MRTARHRFNGLLNKLGCIGSGLCRLGSKVSDLVRNNGKALARGARSRSLNGGIKRENIGLECDILDRLDNILDLV